ncbi:MAG: transcriptional regulator [Sneathiella sp.]|jgi:DNA-binding MarR family transcriptional regulator|uniref:MarR family winged helix-turn-helix transcriptional regulator n=1 Tax=Sneathiella sp. TaxID=1964365 RepID=UPI000C3D65B3|nr:MarR family transcriptional regulator [Sneathiella sp.]MAL80247.1 transcriptional regulator [Sneathiella sp.]|tara:strand:+ start:387 stop:887 length:501 start_codon:yes stop_codon:yes gene_type:complete
MVEDFVRGKGYLTLGTRLKRIGDRLQADVQQLIDADGIAVQTGQYPLLAALDELGPLTVGDLAAALGVSQPGVTRSIGQLVRAGVVKAVRGRTDQRTKVVTLTARGRALVDQGKHSLWPLIAQTLAEICGDRRAPLLDQLDHLEAALTEKSLLRRVTSRDREGGNE